MLYIWILNWNILYESVNFIYQTIQFEEMTFQIKSVLILDIVVNMNNWLMCYVHSFFMYILKWKKKKGEKEQEKGEISTQEISSN